jgi:hypothetical protein
MAAWSLNVAFLIMALRTTTLTLPQGPIPPPALTGFSQIWYLY